MKKRSLVFALTGILLLSACGLMKFGVGELKDESEYKSVAVLEDGRTLLFTYTDRRVKREPIGLGWEKRTIYVRDTKYLGVRDIETGQSRILLELKNDRQSLPYGDIFVGRPYGNKILISGHFQRTDASALKKRYYIFDGDAFAADRKTGLTELRQLESDSDQDVNLVAADGTLAVCRRKAGSDDGIREIQIRRPDGRTFLAGNTKTYLDLNCEGVVCFQDAKTSKWRAISTLSGRIQDLTGSPSGHFPLRPEYKIRSVTRPEHGANRLLVWNRQDDGSHLEDEIQPHLDILR